MDVNTKKLTLEERLSQAARKGKRKTKKVNASSSTASPGPSELNEVQKLQSNESSIKADATVPDLEGGDSAREEITQLGTSTTQTNGALSPAEDPLVMIIKEEPWKSWLSEDCLPSQPSDLLKILEPRIKDLLRQNAQISKPDHSASSLVKVIKEKEEIIGQLRQEGEKLSKNELAQNTTIKSLNKKVLELEEEIEILQQELVDKLQTLEELSSDKKNLVEKVRALEDQVRDLKESKVDAESLQAKVSAKDKQLNELRERSAVKEKKLVDSETQLRNEMESLRTTSCEEIASLESSLERLRIELEISNKSSERSSHRDHLEEQCKVLRSELQSNRENWTAWEDALNNKISALETRASQAEKAKRQLLDELTCARKSNESLQVIIKETSTSQTASQKKIEELRSENRSLNSALEDIKDDFKLLQKQYSVQRTHLEHKIDSTENLPLKISAGAQDSVADPVKFDDWLLPSMISPIEDLGTTPNLKENLNNGVFENVQDSPESEKTDLDLDINDIPNEASELRSLPRVGISRQHSSSNNIQRLGSEVPISNQMSAQMVSKLAAEIRRFEVELSSMKIQFDRAQKEKNTANSEIVRLLEENEYLKSLEDEKNCLSQEVKDLQSKLETSLQLLGEKTEQAEELENDVQDLKDMMKQQIQDMIELQTK